MAQDGEISMSVEETNRMRTKLGLKPLRTSVKDRAQQGEESFRTGILRAQVREEEDGVISCTVEETNRIRKLLGMKPLRGVKPVQSSQPKEANHLQERIKRSQERRKRKQKTSLAEKRERELAEQELLELEYKPSDLAGIKLRHHIDDFAEGETVILTLKDRDVMNDDEEEAEQLENPFMVENERIRKRQRKEREILESKRAYAGLDEEGNKRSILAKYDSDDDQGAAAHVLDSSGQVVVNKVSANGGPSKKSYRSEIPASQVARSLSDTIQDNLTKLVANDDFMTADEIEPLDLGQGKRDKKKKKNKKKDKKRKSEKQKHKDLERTDKVRGHERKRTSLGESDEDEPPIDLGSRNQRKNSRKISIDVDENEDEDLDDFGLEASLLQARRAVQTSNKESKLKTSNPPKGNIFMSDDHRYEELFDPDELREDMDNEREGAQPKQGPSSKTNLETPMNEDNGVPSPEKEMSDMEVDHDEQNDQPGKQEKKRSAILEEQPLVRRGLAATLKLLRQTGELKPVEENDGEGRKPSSRDSVSRGEREVKLEYRDKYGRLMSKKEAFRELSYSFHGVRPSKNKVERRLRALEREKQQFAMQTGDTPLGTASALRAVQQNTGSAFVILDRRGGTEPKRETNR